MRETEIKRYRNLNELSQPGGIVLFGSGEDKHIPTCELRQAFTITSNLYNRSFETLPLSEAVTVYNDFVAPLAPEIVLLHIGESDISLFQERAAEFDALYHKLISTIKAQNKKCQIAVISLKNPSNDPSIETLNQHLKHIAASEQCFYGDISARKVWNPKVTMEAASFIYSLGLVRQPLYDLVRILFCYDI